MRKLNEECGVVGVVGSEDAANWVYLSLYALQHRGQEGCGIVVVPEKADLGQGETGFRMQKALGLVADSFRPERLAKLKGSRAIGHVRYSTQGGKKFENIQPYAFKTSLGHLAISHNGNITNAKELRENLEAEGAIFQSTSDSEVIVHLLARQRGETILERLKATVNTIEGAFSLLLMSHDKLYAVRDPNGFRPLIIGKKGAATIVASETCALDLIEASFVREVEPGEVVEIDANSESSYFPMKKAQASFCAFEPIYFARPDSLVFNESIYALRKQMGIELAKEAAVAGADVVIAVPDSGVPMALGFSEQSRVPLELGLVRNHYVGRTFIQPGQEIRDFRVKLKLNPVMSALKNKSVVVVDDSIVRGTTSEKIMRMIRSSGAREIHVRIGSPPITHSCYFGVDTPKRSDLLAAKKNVNQICEQIGATSLAYLSREGLGRALGANSEKYCMACFSGNYPAPIFDEISSEPTDQGGGPGYRSY